MTLELELLEEDDPQPVCRLCAACFRGSCELLRCFSGICMHTDAGMECRSQATGALSMPRHGCAAEQSRRCWSVTAGAGLQAQRVRCIISIIVLSHPPPQSNIVSASSKCP